MGVTYLAISYPNFVLGSIIDPEEANQNNHDIETKLNTLITAHNVSEINITNLGTVKADKTYVDTQNANLAGAGRTTQTIKANFDALVAHKISGDHDGKYYTKTLLDGGQLDNRYYTEVELANGVLDSRYFTETEINSKLTIINNKDISQDVSLSNHKTSIDHDNRYYTKEDLIPWLRGGDTTIREEVFTIVNSNNGDGTFNYSSISGVIDGVLTPEGWQVFTLTTGQYELGTNRIEATINDTLRRSVTSGGLQEIDAKHIALTSPEGSGAEITFKYYERIGMTAEYNIKLASTKPPYNDGKTMWFEMLN